MSGNWPCVVLNPDHAAIFEACTPPEGTVFFSNLAQVGTYTGTPTAVDICPAHQLGAESLDVIPTFSLAVAESANDEIDALIQAGVLQECPDIPTFVSTPHLVPVDDHRAGVRLAVDYDTVNGYLLPDVAFDSIGRPPSNSLFDIRQRAQGYRLYGLAAIKTPLWQIPLRNAVDRRNTAFRWGNRFLEYRVMPPGLDIALPALRYAICSALSGL